MNKFNFFNDFLFLKFISKTKFFMKKSILKNFKKAIKNNIDYIQITNPTAEQDNYFRAIGKTVSIIKLANKYNLPILHRNASTHIRYLCYELNLDCPKLYSFREVLEKPILRGLRMILVDEIISIEEIEKIKKQNPMIKIVGFARINKNKINNN